MAAATAADESTWNQEAPELTRIAEFASVSRPGDNQQTYGKNHSTSGPCCAWNIVSSQAQPIYRVDTTSGFEPTTTVPSS